jgi:hypothetical protein
MISLFSSIPNINWVEMKDYKEMFDGVGFINVEIQDISENVFGGLANHCKSMDKRYRSGWCWDFTGEEGNLSIPDGWYKYGTVLPVLFSYLASSKDLQFVLVRAKK